MSLISRSSTKPRAVVLRRVGFALTLLQSRLREYITPRNIFMPTRNVVVRFAYGLIIVLCTITAALSPVTYITATSLGGMAQTAS